jgi:hypothetical protein
MREQRFSVRPNEAKRLVIRSGRFGRRYEVLFDDRLLASLSRRELKAGWKRGAEGGPQLSVRLVRSGYDIRMNGLPVPGSAAHPLKQAQTAARILYVIGALNLLFAGILLVLVGRPDTIQWITIGITALAGILTAFLGLFVGRGSALALGIVLALYVFDTFQLALNLLASLNLIGLISAMIVRILILTELARAVGPLLEIARARRAKVPFQGDNRLPQVLRRMPSDGRTRFWLVTSALAVLTVIAIVLPLLNLARQPNVPQVVMPATRTPTDTPDGPTRTPTITLTPSLTFTPSITPTVQPTLTPSLTPTPWTGLERIGISHSASSVLYDAPRDRIIGLSADEPLVWWLDAGGAEVRRATLPAVPDDACVDDSGDRLYVILPVSGDIHVLDLASGAAGDVLTWPAPPSEPTRSMGFRFRVRCQPGRLFMTDTQWWPGLWSLDLADPDAPPVAYSLPDVRYGSTESDNGIGDFTFTADGSELYYWYQSGGFTGSLVIRARLEENRLVLLDQYFEPRALTRDPLDTPILLDEAGGRLIAKHMIFDIGDLSAPVYVFPHAPGDMSDTEDFYAVDWNRGLAATRTAIVSLADFTVSDLPFLNAQYLFFDSAGRLNLFSNRDFILYRLPV